MRLKFFVLAALLLTSMGFSVIPAMAQINPQQPQIDDPVALTEDLRSVVESAPQELFRDIPGEGTDKDLREVLIKKIDVVIMMFQKENFQGGYKKLDNDIAPKLNFCGTVRVRALSWLSADILPEYMVYAFADTCQDLIELIRLADPRPTP